MGEFDEGLMHGVGVLYFQQHGLRYEGQFQQDQVDCFQVFSLCLGIKGDKNFCYNSESKHSNVPRHIA